MFNDAGIVGKLNPNIINNTQLHFEETIKVNLIGPFLGTKHATRVMIPTQQGSIITIASICSAIGGLATHAYTSSKHGVVGLTRNTVVELGKYGIRVNCVSPHVVATPMTKKFFDLDDEGVSKLYSNLKGLGVRWKILEMLRCFLQVMNQSSLVDTILLWMGDLLLPIQACVCLNSSKYDNNYKAKY
ncbi:Momilactone A synthase [Bienertia sinuspersici]